MSVHYKFKSTLNYDTISFDGLHISVGDLKKSIVDQKRLGKMIDFDLQITNAQTKEVYTTDAALIPKNTSLVIARIPLSQQVKKSWETPIDKNTTRPRTKPESVSLDISKMEGSEEEKIREMMLQSTAEYDPKSYQRMKGYFQTGEVPQSYRCNKCKKGGHWIKNCPLGSKELSDVKRTTGIPKSFRDKDGRVIEPEKTEILPSAVEKKTPIPDDLLCSMCNDLFTDAVMIPCCGTSFCDDCVRTALLESEFNECPECKEKGSSPGALIPNRFLRNSVNVFKNESGYTTTAVRKEKSQKETNDQQNSTRPVAKEATDENKCSLNIKEAEVNATAAETKQQKEENSPKSSVPVGEAAEIVVQRPQQEPKKPIIEETPVFSAETSTTAESHHADMESDVEDNITVTVPKVEQRETIVPEANPYFEGNQNRSKPVEHEPIVHNVPTVSKFNNQVGNSYGPYDEAPQLNVEWQKNKFHNEYKPNNMHGDIHSMRNVRGVYPYSKNVPGPPQNYPYCGNGPRNVRPLLSYDMPNPGMNQPNLYDQRASQHYMMQVPIAPVVNQFPNHYGVIAPRPNISFGEYMPHENANNSHVYAQSREAQFETGRSMTPHKLASLYQDVAEKVGTGIIDDPLEAFNRIMKEKERQKEARAHNAERYLQSENRAHTNRFRMSPVDQKSRSKYSREYKSRDNERQKSIDRSHRRKDRDYDRDNDMKREENFVKTNSSHRRSTSYIDKNIRSRSNSLNRIRSISPNRKRESHGRNVKEKILSKMEMNSSPIPEDGPSKMDSQEPPPPGFERCADNYTRPWSFNQTEMIHKDNSDRSYRRTDKEKYIGNSISHKDRSNQFESRENREIMDKTSKGHEYRSNKRNLDERRNREKIGGKEDRVKEERMKDDRIKEDRFKEERVKEDRDKEDRVKEDRGKEDRVKEDRGKEDRVKDDKHIDRRNVSKDRLEKSNKICAVSKRSESPKGGHPISAREHRDDSTKTTADMYTNKSPLSYRSSRMSPHKRSKQYETKKDSSESRYEKKHDRHERKKKRKDKTQKKKIKKDKKDKSFNTFDAEGNRETRKAEDSTILSSKQNTPPHEGVLNINRNAISFDDTKSASLRSDTKRDREGSYCFKLSSSSSSNRNISPQPSQTTTVATALENYVNKPSPSRWEREESSCTSTPHNPFNVPIMERSDNCNINDDKKITSEIMRKAENTIFSRTGEHGRSLATSNKSDRFGDNHNKSSLINEHIQITVPSSNSNDQVCRLVEGSNSRLNRNESSSRSSRLNTCNNNYVKNRLGSKIVCDKFQRRNSFNLTRRSSLDHHHYHQHHDEQLYNKLPSSDRSSRGEREHNNGGVDHANNNKKKQSERLDRLESTNDGGRDKDLEQRSESRNKHTTENCIRKVSEKSKNEIEVKLHSHSQFKNDNFPVNDDEFMKMECEYESNRLPACDNGERKDVLYTNKRSLPDDNDNTDSDGKSGEYKRKRKYKSKKEKKRSRRSSRSDLCSSVDSSVKYKKRSKTDRKSKKNKK